RTDGKIEHEISQSATLVPWFTNYPYAYASADATPLYLIAMREYAVASGDVGFVKEKWDSIWRAYQFLRSTWDADGLPQNQNVGHGWIEGGPLLPVKTELYQSGLGTEAIHALAELAHLTGQEKIVGESEERFGREKKLVNQLFWSAENHSFAFALDASNKKLATPSVLATVPMWFGGTRDRGALRRFLSAAFNQLAAPGLVLCHGGEPAAARPAGTGSFRARTPSDFGAACSR